MHPVYRLRCNDHVIALTAGQWSPRNFGHVTEKYSKFAYSTHFGFSVARDSTGLSAGAYDSMLALSDGDDYWRVRRDCVSVQIADHIISSVWKPWTDVEIRTELIDQFPWHIRLHTVRTGRKLEIAEGAFAAPRPDGIDLVINCVFRGKSSSDSNRRHPVIPIEGIQ